MLDTCCRALRKRWKEIREIHREHKLFYLLLAGSVLLLALVWVGVMLFVDKENLGYEMNLFTEGLGVYVSIGITVLGVDIAYALRDKKRLRERLKREAGSRSNAIAIGAVEWLRAEGWLQGDDGLLKGEETVLNYANLQGANLTRANLQGTKLVQAKLQGTDLFQANLCGASLYGANLCKAQLQGANLSNANLKSADLRDAKMRYFHIQEKEEIGLDLMNETPQRTNLNGADLEGAYLAGATLPDEENLADVLRWPDGEQYSGTGLLEKLKKFTDINHPEFKSTLDKIERERKYQRYVGEPETFADPEAD